jgi:hypothetical protein
VSAEGEAQAGLLNILAGEVCRLMWQALAVETVLEDRGITRVDLREEVSRIERTWAEAAELESLGGDPAFRLLLAALRARGWRPPAREGETPP